MKREIIKPLVVTCIECGFDNVFNQPYRYHAGFANQGFLYNEAGDRTLIWSSFDPDYTNIVGENHPWVLGVEGRNKLEAVLQSDPNGGGKWLFTNLPRCLKCKHPIGEPIGRNIYYLEYDGSINLDFSGSDRSRRLKEIMKVEPAATAVSAGAPPLVP